MNITGNHKQRDCNQFGGGNCVNVDTNLISNRGDVSKKRLSTRTAARRRELSTKHLAANLICLHVMPAGMKLDERNPVVKKGPDHS